MHYSLYLELEKVNSPLKCFRHYQNILYLNPKKVNKNINFYMKINLINSWIRELKGGRFESTLEKLKK